MNYTEGLEFKVVLLGFQAVGKSSIVKRYVKDEFGNEESTIGAAFYSKRQISSSGKYHRIQLWDTAGQERYAGLAPMYYRNSDAIVIVYDSAWESTIKEAERWVEEVTKYEPNSLIVVVENKVDTLGRVEECSVMDNRIKSEVQRRIDIFSKSSAKTGMGIPNLFQNIVDHLEIRGNVLSRRADEVLSGRAYDRNSSQRRIELNRRIEIKRDYCC